MARVSFDFKSTIDAMIGGAGHSLCFQCGACVGDCPAATYSERFNPRQIMLQAVLGLAGLDRWSQNAATSAPCLMVSHQTILLIIDSRRLTGAYFT